LATIFIIATIAPAHADIIIGNLPQTSDSTFGTVGAGPPFPDVPGVPELPPLFFTWAYGFTVGNQEQTISDVVLRLSGYDTADDVSDTRIAFFADDGTGSPGTTQVGSNLINPNGASGISSFVFNANDVTLAADTRYWLTATTSGTNGFNWHGSSPSIIPTGTGASDFALKSRIPILGPTWNDNGAARLSLQINGIAVPEPGTIALIVSGFGVLLLLQRPRRESNPH
jgi:hypothetical protein